MSRIEQDPSRRFLNRGVSLHKKLKATCLAVVLMGSGCGWDEARSKDPLAEVDESEERSSDSTPYATEVVEFNPGEGAGFGQDRFPDIVLGAPKGRGSAAGTLDVLSLGAGGEITLSVEPRQIVDGEGADFVVFENPFWPQGKAEEVWAELGQVEVSQDGRSWFVFPCDTRSTEIGRWPGCAGWTPTLEYDPTELIPIDPLKSGGDTFDLADVGLQTARFVRIRDLSDFAQPPSAGFDLDALGLINYLPE